MYTLSLWQSNFGFDGLNGIAGSLKTTQPNLHLWWLNRGSIKRQPFHFQFIRFVFIKTSVNLSRIMFSFRECLSTIDYEKGTELNIRVYNSVTMFRFNPLKIKDKYASTFVPLVWVLLSKGRLFSHPRPLSFIVMKMLYLHNMSSFNHAFPTFLSKCIVVKHSIARARTQLYTQRAVNRRGIKHRLIMFCSSELIIQNCLFCDQLNIWEMPKIALKSRTLKAANHV